MESEVTSFSTPYVDDDIGVGVLGQRLGDDSLSAPESSGNGCGSTLDTTGIKINISYLIIEQFVNCIKITAGLKKILH